ncbi:putative S-adenosyl-L-methionine-dependent methyltransferase TehB [Methylobacterium brachiatum]|nr:putative S-adenosyl-L-methionine-dependent methyltransferase TehB [Methylobacterium brachiatum]
MNRSGGMKSIPAGYVVYRRTPEYTRATIPKPLLSRHETKRGAWALIRILEGELRYCIEDPPFETILTPERPGVVEPEVPHRIEPIGDVRFFLEFHYDPQRHPTGDPGAGA